MREESMGRFVVPLFFLILSTSFLASGFVRGDCGPGYTVVKVEPSSVAMGSRSDNCIGDRFTLAVNVCNVPAGGWALYGLDIMLYWNLTYLEYVSHIVKAPVEQYPDGVLHGPIFVTKNEVNVTTGVYWLAMATLSFEGTSGNGTIFEITFAIKHQPFEPSPAATFQVTFDSSLAPSYACPIAHSREFSNITIGALASPDVNRDGIVDIHDIVAVGSHYGCREGDANWNRDADLAPRWGIIDIFDCVTCAYHYGEQYPQGI